MNLNQEPDVHPFQIVHGRRAMTWQTTRDLLHQIMGLAPCLSYFVRVYKLLLIKFIAITKEKHLPMVVSLSVSACVKSKSGSCNLQYLLQQPIRCVVVSVVIRNFRHGILFLRSSMGKFRVWRGNTSCKWNAHLFS